MSTIALLIGIISVGHLLAYVVFIIWTTHIKPGDNTPPGEVIGHTWDGDIQEINNPSPRWILTLFYLMIAIAGLYLVLYPGVWKGVLGWTQLNQYEAQVAKESQLENEYFSFYNTKTVQELTQNPEAMASGRRIFRQNCAVCHGDDAGGSVGNYPNLTDNDWLYGGTPEKIIETISKGRHGIMPPNGGLVNPSDEDLVAVANYVHQLEGRKADPALAAKGKELYSKSCIGCHGPEGKGNQIMGAANIADNIWLYSEKGTIDDIVSQIRHPKGHQMPAWLNKLGEKKIKVVAAYIYSLSHDSSDQK